MAAWPGSFDQLDDRGQLKFKRVVVTLGELFRGAVGAANFPRAAPGRI